MSPACRTRGERAGAVVLVVMACLLGACGGSMTRSVELHRNAQLTISAATPNGTPIRYAVDAGERWVLVVTEKASGRLFSSDPGKTRVAAIELPADAAGQTVSLVDRSVFGRVTAGDVQFLSHKAEGTLRVEPIGEGASTVKVTLSVRFVEPDIDVLKTGLAFEGAFEVEIER